MSNRNINKKSFQPNNIEATSRFNIPESLPSNHIIYYIEDNFLICKRIIFYTAYRVLKSEPKANDIVQEVFEEIWSNPHRRSLIIRRSASAMLRRIAYRLALKQKEKDKRL